MSEIRDRARDKIGKKLFIQKHREETWNSLVPEIKEFWLCAADQILSIPELACVDRTDMEALLPNNPYKWNKDYEDKTRDRGIYYGYEEAQQDMLKAGWVKEVRGEKLGR